MAVMNTGLGQIAFIYLFTCVIIVLESRLVGQLWNFGGGSNRNCEVPQGRATHFQILSW